VSNRFTCGYSLLGIPFLFEITISSLSSIQDNTQNPIPSPGGTLMRMAITLYRRRVGSIRETFAKNKNILKELEKQKIDSTKRYFEELDGIHTDMIRHASLIWQGHLDTEKKLATVDDDFPDYDDRARKINDVEQSFIDEMAKLDLRLRTSIAAR
jgi:hypothetical protein